MDFKDISIKELSDGQMEELRVQILDETPLAIKKEIRAILAEAPFEEVVELILTSFGVENAQDLEDTSREEKLQIVGAIFMYCAVANRMDYVVNLVKAGWRLQNEQAEKLSLL